MTQRHTVVFCGTPAFAVPSLNALAGDPAFDVRLVISQPDRPTGRHMALTPTPVKTAAEELGIEVMQPEKLNAALPELERQFTPDFLIVVAYGQILSQEVLDWPRIAPINVHGSLLPRWRGASPVEHAVLVGDATTGITIQTMVKQLDAGDILAMEEVSIGTDETALQLRNRLSLLGAQLLVRTLHQPLNPVPQSAEGITFCSKLSREDGQADPETMTAEEIHRRVRAFVPWPGVRCVIDGEDVKIIEATLDPTPETVPLSCKDGTTLHLLTVHPPSKKPMKAADWMRGRRNSTS